MDLGILLKIIAIIVNSILFYNIVRIIKMYYYKRLYNEEYKRFDYYWNFIKSDYFLEIMDKKPDMYSGIMDLKFEIKIPKTYKDSYKDYLQYNNKLYIIIKDYLPGEKQKIRSKAIDEILK